MSPAAWVGATGKASGTISGARRCLSLNISAAEFPCQSSALSHLPGQFGMTWSGCCSGHQTCHGKQRNKWVSSTKGCGERRRVSFEQGQWTAHMATWGARHQRERQGKKRPAEHSEACRTPMDGACCIFSGDAFSSPANPHSGFGHIVRTLLVAISGKGQYTQRYFPFFLSLSLFFRVLSWWHNPTATSVPELRPIARTLSWQRPRRLGLPGARQEPRAVGPPGVAAAAAHPHVRPAPASGLDPNLGNRGQGPRSTHRTSGSRLPSS